MGKDYYQTLQISREASQEQIIQSYRRLALKHHPIKNPGELAANSYKFTQISEAFDVLSDCTNTYFQEQCLSYASLENRRAIFDQYGQELLKQGITDKKGNLKGGYAFLGNSFEIFQDVFGNMNPFIDIIQAQGDMQGSLFQDSFKAQGEKKSDMPKDLQVVIQCTLQQFFIGCVKDFQVKREKLALDGKHTKIIKQIQKIEVKPGYGKKTVVRQAEQGHQSFGNKTTDLVIRFKEKKDEKFSRKENDLIYTHTISLIDAINATSFQLTSLDGRVLPVGVDCIITPQTFKLIKGEGMPIFDENPLVALTKQNKKGDLYVKFNIIFPKYIPEQKKEQLRQILVEEEEVQ